MQVRPMSPDGLQVLLIAPALSSTDVGEAWVGYQWARRLSDRHHVTVLTYVKKGQESAASQLPKARVIEWPERLAFTRAERFNSLVKPAYLSFYVDASRWITKAFRSGIRFDIGHQVTPVAMRYPSPLASAPFPYVLGPVAGSLESPPAFIAEEGTSPWYTKARSLDNWRLEHDPLLKRSFEGASLVLGVAPYVRDRLSGLNLKRFEIMGETGLPTLPAITQREDRLPPTRLLFVGRLVRTKGARDAVRAMHHIKDLRVHLDIVGDGPDAEACRRLATDLVVTDRVEFHGRLPRAEIEKFYEAADIFLFPSYREPGGNVQFEAMGHGLPLVVSALGGTAAAVDKDCAITVTPHDPASYAQALADAVRQLINDPEKRRRMGAAARRRAESVGLWEPKIERMSSLYEELVHG